MKRKLKINLLLQIVIAIGLGIGCGYVVPEWLGRLFATFNAVFSQLLGFLIPLIILGFVASAIADIGRSAGKMLVATAAIAYVATVCSGLLSFAVGDTVFPHLITPKALSSGIPGGGDLTHNRDSAADVRHDRTRARVPARNLHGFSERRHATPVLQ